MVMQVSIKYLEFCKTKPIMLHIYTHYTITLNGLLYFALYFWLYFALYFWLSRFVSSLRNFLNFNQEMEMCNIIDCSKRRRTADSYTWRTIYLYYFLQTLSVRDFLFINRTPALDFIILGAAITLLLLLAIVTISHGLYI